MLLLLDENVPIATVRALRAAGHDVYSATESSAGAPDELLLARADAERRLLITFDRDFGELAVRCVVALLEESSFCALRQAVLRKLRNYSLRLWHERTWSGASASA